MEFDYDHQQSLAASKALRRENSYADLRPNTGFGSGQHRFNKSTTPVPGIGTYSIAPAEALLQRSPSFSRKGYTNSFVSKSPQLIPRPDTGVPGPAHYDTEKTTIAYLSKLGKSTMVKSGKGRVPFPEPNENPGPLYYKINHDHADPPRLRKKKSASFCSTVGRDSFFDILPLGAKLSYDTSKSSITPSGNVYWSGKKEQRFTQIGYDNKVPPSTTYFKGTVNADEEKVKRRGLRTVGVSHKALMGKQNEKRSPALHTFGADKDRFKNSAYGRLDLAALIPGPSQYYVDYYARERDKHRAGTASSLQAKQRLQ